MNQHLIDIFREKGLLVDGKVLEFLEGINDFESIRLFIEKIKECTGVKFLTFDTFMKNKEKIESYFSLIGFEGGSFLEIKERFGLEEQKKKVLGSSQEFSINTEHGSVSVNFPVSSCEIKLSVKNFVDYFRQRFELYKNVLSDKSELENLVSIDKIGKNKRNLSIIGIVYDKRITKNNNLILEVEDLTGKINLLISKDKKEIYEQALEIPLDCVLGFKCSGDNRFLFVNEVIYPDCFLHEKKNSFNEEIALFISDLHFGSKRFLEKSFLKFVEYLNGKFGNFDEVQKIKYLFIVGDIVTGVGVYPGQQKDLEKIDLEEQFKGIANFLSMIRKDIKIIISPGNHEGMRIMEPQPVFAEKYAWPLYDLENVFLTGNPAIVTIGKTASFNGFNVLTYHGFSFPYYAKNIPHLVLGNAMNNPVSIMEYLLKFRHLAPTHSSIQYFPMEKDPFFIKQIPDIFVAGHTHKSGIIYHNNILVISGSSWEGKSSYQEKFGNEPDHCKVPLFNLKTREIKILDFEDSDELKEKNGL